MTLSQNHLVLDLEPEMDHIGHASLSRAMAPRQYRQMRHDLEPKPSCVEPKQIIKGLGLGLGFRVWEPRLEGVVRGI